MGDCNGSKFYFPLLSFAFASVSNQTFKQLPLSFPLRVRLPKIIVFIVKQQKKKTIGIMLRYFSASVNICAGCCCCCFFFFNFANSLRFYCGDEFFFFMFCCVSRCQGGRVEGMRRGGGSRVHKQR